MMQNIPNPLYIQLQWPNLLLYITYNVVVVLCLDPWFEIHLYCDLGISTNNTLKLLYLQRVCIFRISLDCFLLELEEEWCVLKIVYVNNFPTFSTKQKRSEIDLSNIKENVGLCDCADQIEPLTDLVRRNFKKPESFMFS